MVRVPVTESKWSTWKRYCELSGVSMGRAIVTLIDRELVSVFGDCRGDDSPVFAEEAEAALYGRALRFVGPTAVVPSCHVPLRVLAGHREHREEAWEWRPCRDNASS